MSEVHCNINIVCWICTAIKKTSKIFTNKLKTWILHKNRTRCSSQVNWLIWTRQINQIRIYNIENLVLYYKRLNWIKCTHHVYISSINYYNLSIKIHTVRIYIYAHGRSAIWWSFAKLYPNKCIVLMLVNVIIVINFESYYMYRVYRSMISISLKISIQAILQLSNKRLYSHTYRHIVVILVIAQTFCYLHWNSHFDSIISRLYCVYL